MERTERMIGTLCEEWQNIIVLCSRVGEDGRTEVYRYECGNALANQQLLEDTVDDMVCGAFISEEDDGEEEKF